MPENSDPAVWWLMFTNFALGAVVLVCLGLLAGAVVMDVVRRWRTRTADDHAFAVPELGLTMADGGEREDHPIFKQRRER